MRFTLTSRPLLQLPLRNTDFIRSSLLLSFLSFNSGGPELRATSKIRPANAPTAVPDLGGIKKVEFVWAWGEHGGIQVGFGRRALGNPPFSLSAYPQSPPGLAHSQKGGIKLPALGSHVCSENRPPWFRACQTNMCMSHTSEPLQPTKQTLLRILSTEEAMRIAVAEPAPPIMAMATSSTARGLMRATCRFGRSLTVANPKRFPQEAPLKLHLWLTA